MPTTEDLERELLELQRQRAEFELQQARAAARRERSEHERSVAQARREAALTQKAAEQETRRRAVSDSLGALSAGVASLKGSTLSLPEEAVFRESLAAGAALTAAAEQAAAAIRAVSPKATDGILVTGRIDQAESLLAYQSFRAALGLFSAEAARALAESYREEIARGTRIPLPQGGEGGPAEELVQALAPMLPSILGSAVDLGVKALSAVAVETTVEAAQRTATEIQTHVAVVTALLNTEDAVVLHERLGLQQVDESLLSDFTELQATLPQLDAKARQYQTQIDQLDEKNPEQSRRIAVFAAHKAEVEALAARITEFVTAANAVDPNSGTSPLRTILQSSHLISGSSEAPKFIAVVLPAQIDAHQISLKRRLVAPRVLVSASAEIDIVLIDVATGRIRAAGSHIAERGFQLRFPMRWWGSEQRFAPRYTTINGGPL